MPPQTPSGPDCARLLAAACLVGWGAAALAEAATLAVDHAAGGTASELRSGSLAGLALALALPWARALDRRHRLGPPRPVRGVLALGALAAAVPAALLPLCPAWLLGSAAGAGVLGALGALLLAAPFALLLGARAPGSVAAALIGAVLAGPSSSALGSLAAASHAASTACAVAAVLLLRSSADLRAVPVARLPGSGATWGGILAAGSVVVALLVLPWLGFAPFGQPRHAVPCACILLGLATPRPGSRPRGAALAAGLLLAHVLGLGGEGLRGGVAAASEPRTVRVLGRQGNQGLVWDRATQELALYEGSLRIDCHGPDRNHGALAGLVAMGLATPGTPLHVHECVQAAAVLHELGATGVRESVAHRERVALAVRARVDGPVEVPAAASLHPPAPDFACLRRSLRAVSPGSLGALVTGFPGPHALYAADHGFHAEARRALGNGVLVVPLPLDLVPAELLRASVAAARAVHPQVHLLLVREVLLLVADGNPAPWSQRKTLPAEAGRWWWRAGTADLGDLARARIGLASHPGTVPQPDALHLLRAAGHDAGLGARDRIRAAMSFLRSVALPGDAALESRLLLRERAGAADVAAPAATAQLRAEREASHLLLDEVQQARLLASVGMVRTADPEDPAAVHAAAVAASSWCHVGAPHAILQAALGLTNASGTSVHDPAAAAQFAHAVDPTLATLAPPVLRPVFAVLGESGAAAPGALEDLARLPDGAGLAALCTGATPLATALRARFGPACAAALLSVRSQRAWTLAELGALRELASIAMVDAAAELLLALGSPAEVLSVWRLDLPVSRGIERLLDAGEAGRLALAQALPRRKDPRAARALARLMTDAAPSVRAAAGAALERSWPGAVAYDPTWERSRLEEAARAVLALHNPRP